MKVFEIINFLICTLGIYASYLTQGYVSEALATSNFNNTRFHSLWLLSGIQSLPCWIFAEIISFFLINKKTKKILAPREKYMYPSLTATIGPPMGIFALKYINYSAQVVVKSCKLIPIMVMGALIYKVKYTRNDWIVISCICSGLAIFSMKASKKAVSKLSTPNMALGYLLCLFNLISDGFTNSAQDNLKKEYKTTSSIHMMSAMNMWMFIYNFIFIAATELYGLTSVIKELIELSVDIQFLKYIGLFCLCGCTGQLFIFWMIKTYGSVTNTLVCTTRKFFSILLSVLWSHTPLVLTQWCGVYLVFIGILGNLYIKQQRHLAKKKKE